MYFYLKLTVLFMVVAFATAGVGFAADGADNESLPLISDMTQTKVNEEGKVVTQEEQKATYPRALGATEELEDIDLLPDGAFLYLTITNGAEFDKSYQQTSGAMLLEEEKVKLFLRENDFSLSQLMQDLPEDYSSARATEILTASMKLMRTFLNTEGRISLAVYVGENSGPEYIYMANIGRERKPAYDRLESTIDTILSGSSELILQKADHSDDYIEVLRPAGSDKTLAYGFVRNHLLICNNPDRARSLMARAAKDDGAATLADSSARNSIAAKTAPDSPLRGYFDLTKLTAAISETSLTRAREMLAFIGDMTTREILYYDMQPSGKDIRENLTIPLSLGDEVATLATRIEMISRPSNELTADKLTTPKLMPYQPDMFVAMKIKPADAVSLLQEQILFGASKTAMDVNRLRPRAISRVFGALGEQADAILEGEVGCMINHNPQAEAGMDWLVAMPLRNAPEAEAALERNSNSVQEISGIKAYYGGGEFHNVPAWAVLAQSQTSFRNLGQSFLVIASSGGLLQNTIDRALGGGAILANNRDFRARLIDLPGDEVGVIYENLPKAIQTGYPVNLRAFIRDTFSRLSTPHAMPPLRAIKDHLSGIAGIMTITDQQDLRLTYISPTSVVPVSVSKILLQTPQWLRQREESAILEARQDLGELGLALQEYATQHGHFPNSLTAEIERRELATLLPQSRALDDILVNPAAELRLGNEAEARDQSYSYVPGLLPSDLPSQVLVYTSKPWHYHYRTDDRQIYEACRLVLTLDGNITSYSEAEFTKRVLPRIQNQR